MTTFWVSVFVQANNFFYLTSRGGTLIRSKLHKRDFIVEKQVTILYALTHGFLDTVPVDEIVRFEEEFHAFFDAQHPEILETIRDTKDLPDEAVLDAAITEFLNQTSFQ